MNCFSACEWLQEFDDHNYWNTLNHMEGDCEINEKYKELEDTVVSYNSFGRMEEAKRHELIKWQAEGLKGATGILERV